MRLVTLISVEPHDLIRSEPRVTVRRDQSPGACNRQQQSQVHSFQKPRRQSDQTRSYRDPPDHRPGQGSSPWKKSWKPDSQPPLSQIDQPVSYPNRPEKWDGESSPASFSCWAFTRTTKMATKTRHSKAVVLPVQAEVPGCSSDIISRPVTAKKPLAKARDPGTPVS